MAKILPLNKCQARDPHTCRYHGAMLRMQEAQEKSDFDAYFKSRLEFEAIEKKGWSEDGRIHSIKDLLSSSSKRKQQKLEEYLYNNQLPVKGLTKDLLNHYNLSRTDYLAMTPMEKGYWAGDRSGDMARYVMRQDENGDWQKLAWSAYYDFHIVSEQRRYLPVTDGQEVIMSYILRSAKEYVEKKKLMRE